MHTRKSKDKTEVTLTARGSAYLELLKRCEHRSASRACKSMYEYEYVAKVGD